MVNCATMKPTSERDMTPSIERIEIFPVGIPVTRTFRFASGSAGAAGERAPHVFVRITDSEGNIGWGEARPMPQWSYETAEAVTAAIQRYLAPAIIGMPIHDRWGLHQRMHQVIGRGPSTGQPMAKAAIDMAVHDLCARAAGVSLRRFLGGSDDRRSVALSYTITAHTAHEARLQVQEARSNGFRHFNFKAAVTRENDTAVAEGIRDEAGPGAFVWADANQGLQLHEAVKLCQAFQSIGVDVLEQPLPADQAHLMRSLRARTWLPLAIDESSVSPADFFLYASERLVDYLVIKLIRSGGIWPTLQQIGVAQAGGLPLLVSGLTESLLSKVAACQVAAAFGFNGPAALNGSQFLDESMLYPDKAALEWEGTVHLPDSPGIGVAPDEEALRELALQL